jgi:hypothetical protein
MGHDPVAYGDLDEQRVVARSDFFSEASGVSHLVGGCGQARVEMDGSPGDGDLGSVIVVGLDDGLNLAKPEISAK